MNHKIISVLIICLSGFAMMLGQTENIKVIKPVKSSMEDYISLLNDNGYENFSFDISSLSDDQYKIAIKIKEYKNGQEVSADILGDRLTFKNMVLISDFPKEDQETFKPEEMADPERGIFTIAKKMMAGFTPAINDSIRPLSLEIENMGSIRIRLPLLPQYKNNDSINGEKLFLYQTKPFKVDELSVGKFIPLVMYGSFWYDKDFGIHRFCGENEVESDMSSRIFQYIPHYYVIGIEVFPMNTLSSIC